MSTRTQVNELKINRMTKDQYKEITPSDTELYFVTDESDTLPEQAGNAGKFLTTDGSIPSWTDVDALPSQEGQANKFLTTDGSIPSWTDVDALPSQEGQANKFLTTDGTVASWETVDALPNQEGQANKFLTTDGTVASWSYLDIPSSRCIGEIITSTVPLQDAGLHLLDGSVLSDDGSYSDFVAYVHQLALDHPELVIEDEDWQASVAQYGVCGKFVEDPNGYDPGSIRLPKITGFIQGTTNVSDLGNIVEAGLPNITGYFSGCEIVFKSGYTPPPFGAFYQEAANVVDGDAPNTSFDNDVWGFDASRSNNIYGNSTTVQPQAIQVFYYIVVANLINTSDLMVDINRVESDLAYKADTDLSNVSNCTVLDGQWVSSSSTLANNISAPTTTNLEYSLASYLPNDGYNYEVLFTGQATSGASSGNVCNIHLKTDIIADYVYFARAVTKTTSNNSTYGTCILPVGTGRTVTAVAYSNNTGNFYLYARGYRRIGTNT